MKDTLAKGINAHFRREGIFPGVMTLLLLALGLLMTFLAPWLFGGP